MGKAAEAHSRRNPSARYRRLLELYREMHVRSELTRGIGPERTCPGSSLLPQAHHMRRLVAQTGARSILDYGSGKGSQYRPLKLAEQGVARWASVQEYWGVERIVCFDPAYEPFSRPPQGRSNGCPGVLWEARAYTEGSEGGDVRLGNAAGAELSPVAIA